MWQDFLHSFDPSQESWYGSIRTLQFCAPILEKISKNLPIPLIPVSRWILPASAGWDFVNQHKLNWAIDTDMEDEVIRREFLRHPLPESIRSELRNFLQSHLPGLLLMEAVFKGEDMGVSPYPHLFPRKYVVDPNLSIVERLRVLEQNIKEILSRVFFAESRKCFSAILLPLEDWMVSVSVAEIPLARRGSFYYPDMSAVVWSTGAPQCERGMLVPGWWEPLHPQFPMPVEFVPGETIGPGPTHLLALEFRMGGQERMVLIPRHLAKTHGTMNLTLVREDQEVSLPGTSTRSTTHLVAGPDQRSPLSETAAHVIRTLTGEMQIPLTMQMLVHPDSVSGRTCASLFSVRPHNPPQLSTPISRPVTGLLESVIEGCSARGIGSGFSRYILILNEPLPREAENSLLHDLRAIEGMGESAMVLSKNVLDTWLWDLLVQSRAVVGVCAPNGHEHPTRPDLLHFECDCSTMKMDAFRQNISPLANPGGLPWYVIPKPVRMTANGSRGMAWL